MLFYIAYPNGGMGHTILAHSLYASRQIEIDLDNFFDRTGHAHNINQFPKRGLCCYHPQFGIKPNTILSVSCRGKYEIMRKMMAYAKHHGQYPESNTLDTFGFRGWQDMLPLEFLSINFFHFFHESEILPSTKIALDDYLHNRLDTLKSAVQSNLSWNWDSVLSDRFYLRMMEANRRFIQRTNYLEQLVEATKSLNETNCDLKFWEKAAVISWVCYDLQIYPGKLLWNDHQFLDSSNRELICAIQKYCSA